jgi:hypothetical protein
MDRDAVFEAWAPPGAVWTPWVKPVLFAHLPSEASAEAAPEPVFDLSWAPRATDAAALVIDLAGGDSVALGLALVAAGYRPVPLFNACPPPADPVTPTADLAAVDVAPIMAGLVRGAERLVAARLPEHAPPAFLVDAGRETPRRPIAEGVFDNRSIVFVTDFPSANMLAAQGVHTAVLVRQETSPWGSDLNYVLQMWQRGGISLSLKQLSQPGSPQPIAVGRPGLFAGLWQRLRSYFGLRRNREGGFGEFVASGGG